MKIIVAIPVYISNELHAEFTETTIKSIQTIHKSEIILINNFCKPEFIPRMRVLAKLIYSRENNVAAAWNTGIRYGFEKKADYILIPNNDLIFHPKCIDNLIKFAKLHSEYILWTASEYTDMRTLNLAKFENSFDEHPHFSCFMISPKTIELLKAKEERTKEPNPGFFDENFIVAYFEDGDYHQRILRAGYKAGKTASALFYHFGSRTIHVDDELYTSNKRSYEDNRAYFKQKWGFDPHNSVINNDDPIRFKYKGPFQP